MTQYAYFDSAAPSPSLVLGWYDTGALKYPNLPAAADLLEVTPAQWVARLTDPSGWAVSNGVLVAYAPPTPTPTLAQQAQALLTAGLTITSTSTAALDGTYAADEAAQSRANRIASYVALNGKFPNGAATLDWLDTAGNKHTFPSTAEFQAWFTAMGNFVAACDDVIMEFSSTLPATTATIA